MKKPKMKALCKNTVVIFGMTFLLLGAIEIIGCITEALVDPAPMDYMLGFSEDDRVFIPDPKDPEYLITNPKKELSFHRQRFLKVPQPNVRRIFFLGGSCVLLLQDTNYESFFSKITKKIPGLDPERDFFSGFPGKGISLLEKDLEEACGNRFDFEIINCGAGGYGSHRLVLTLTEILEYNPDLVLYYEGHNEFEEKRQLQYVPSHSLWMQDVLSHSAVYRLLRSYAVQHRTRKMLSPEVREILAHETEAVEYGPTFRNRVLPKRLAALENNLSLMAVLCKENQTPFMLGTVPSNLLRPQIGGTEEIAKYAPVLQLFEEGKYDEAFTLAENVIPYIFHRQATEAENSIIRKVAKEHSLPLADVKAAIIDAEPNKFPGETLFFDNCHFYPKGNKILLDTFFETIQKNSAFVRETTY